MAIQELQTFREKYPQYSDLGDMELADSLARKYPAYADLPAKVKAEGVATAPATPDTLTPYQQRAAAYRESVKSGQPVSDPVGMLFPDDKTDFVSSTGRALKSGMEDVGRSIISAYGALDPARQPTASGVTGALLHGVEPVLGILGVSPPGIGGTMAGETVRSGLESAGAPPDVQAVAGTLANVAVPGKFIPNVVRGIEAPRLRALAASRARAEAARLARAAALNDARVGTVADAITRPSPAALEAPEVIARRQRSADLESAFASQLLDETERNLRQSPRGRDLLADDLRSRQPIEAPGPVSGRAAAIEAELNERDILRRSPREGELLRRRLAAEEQRSQRVAAAEPQAPPPPPPTAEVIPAPTIVAPPRAKPKSPSIEKSFGSYLSDLKISYDKTLVKDRGELQGLIQSPLGKRAVVNDARPNSVSLQEAVERAYEDGYIQTESYAAFRDALDRTVAGEKVLSTKSEAFQRLSKAEQANADRQMVHREADRHIQTITDTPADLEFRGKTYTGAVRQSDGSLRLKDHPDKVIKRDTDVLQVEEKIPFDIPEVTPAPARLSAERVVQKIRSAQTPKYFNEGEIRGQVSRGGESYVKTTVDPATLNIKNEAAVDPRLADPEKGPIVVGADGTVIDGRHRAAQAKQRGEMIEAYVPVDSAPTYPAMARAAERNAREEVRQAAKARALQRAAKAKAARELASSGEDLQAALPYRPSFDKTPAGVQGIIPGAEGRTVPDTPLRPKRAQTDSPLELEQPQLSAKEPDLFNVSEPKPAYGPQAELDIQPVRMRSDLFESQTTTVGQPKPKSASARSDVMYARRTGTAIHDVGEVQIGDVVYDSLLERYGQVTQKYKDSVRVTEGRESWTIGAGNRLQRAETIGQQASLDLRIGEQGKTVLQVLKDESGSTRIFSWGRGVDDAAKHLTREGRQFISKKRLFVGEVAEQSTNTLRKTMGDEGKELADRLFAARNTAETDAGRAIQPLDTAIKKLERGREWENFVDVLEGQARPLNERVANAVSIADGIRKDIARRAGDAELMIKNPLTGETYPFQPRDNFFPHFYKQELGDVVKDPAGRTRIKAQIKERMMMGKRDPDGIIPGLEDWAKSDRSPTDREVELALRAMLKASKTRYGHLEIARMLDLGEYMKDPRLLEKYIVDAYRRVNIAEQLGGKLERGYELTADIGTKFGEDAENFAMLLMERFSGVEPVRDNIWTSGLSVMRNYEAATKLGRAVIPNMSQSAQTAVVTGMTNTGRALKAAFTNEGEAFARRSGVALDFSIREFMHEVSGTAEGPMQRVADAVLRYTGFTTVERMNRIVAANAGKFFAHETFDALQKASGGKAKRLELTLNKLGIDVDKALKRGALSETDELKAAQSIVNRTQFKSDPLELPLFWSSPEGKLLTQFKGFSFKAGQLIKNEVLKEAARGNVAPLARAVLILPAAGFAVKQAQNALRPSSRNDDEGIADYIGAVGALGLFADVFRKSSLSSMEFIAGPALSDVGRGMSATASIVKEGEFEPAAKFAARQVPVIGPTLSGLMARPGSARDRRLRELGMHDEIKGMEKQRAQMRRELKR